MCNCGVKYNPPANRKSQPSVRVSRRKRAKEETLTPSPAPHPGPTLTPSPPNPAGFWVTK